MNKIRLIFVDKVHLFIAQPQRTFAKFLFKLSRKLKQMTSHNKSYTAQFRVQRCVFLLQNYNNTT